jgi:hypothetical protein
LAVNPAKVALFIPAGLAKFKWKLFTRIGEHIKQLGGQVVEHNVDLLPNLPDDVTPIVGCHPQLRHLIDEWNVRGRQYIYWDRGYARRIFATWLPRGENGGYYRWHINSFQMQKIRDVPVDRWNSLQTKVMPWAKGGRHIVIAAPTLTYTAFHRTDRWTDQVVDVLSKVTDRPLMIRGKESKRSLNEDLKGAHALISHQSNAAVEAVIMGCPVFVDPGSAAALVGKTDLQQIEHPIYPERQAWLNSLAYSQFNERELVDGTLWKLIA